MLYSPFFLEMATDVAKTRNIFSASSTENGSCRLKISVCPDTSANTRGVVNLAYLGGVLTATKVNHHFGRHRSRRQEVRGGRRILQELAQHLLSDRGQILLDPDG